MGRKFKFAKTELQYSGQNAKPKYMVIEFLPEQVGTLTYTGEELFPTWKNLDPLKLNIEGELSATNAGKHYITVTPTGIFAWPDMTQTPKQIEYIIERAVIDKVPTQKGSLTFNNTEQSPEWNDFDASKMVIGGVYQNQIRKGKYKATFTPDNNHCWSDKTFAAKEVEWEIKVLELTRPALSQSSYPYTGNAIQPTITNFNANFMSKSGDISATNKGNYTITIGLLFAEDSCWAGGGTANFNLTWAVTALVLPKVTANSLTLTYNGAAQEPQWQNFDARYIEKSGDGANINAKWKDWGAYEASLQTYSTTFAIKAQYKNSVEWQGGGTADITHEWKILPITIKDPMPPTFYIYTMDGLTITEDMIPNLDTEKVEIVDTQLHWDEPPATQQVIHYYCKNPNYAFYLATYGYYAHAGWNLNIVDRRFPFEWVRTDSTEIIYRSMAEAKAGFPVGMTSSTQSEMTRTIRVDANWTIEASIGLNITDTYVQLVATEAAMRTYKIHSKMAYAGANANFFIVAKDNQSYEKPVELRLCAQYYNNGNPYA